jgi:hypothetical protein
MVFLLIMERTTIHTQEITGRIYDGYFPFILIYTTKHKINQQCFLVISVLKEYGFLQRHPDIFMEYTACIIRVKGYAKQKTSRSR